MTKWIVAMVVTLTLPVASLGQDWRYFVGKYGIHKVFTTATAHTPDGTASTTLTLACRPEGGKGGILVTYGVRDAERIKAFDFDYFHGPGAKALGKKLVTVTVKTNQNEATFKMKASGAFSDMDNMKDFQFEIGKAPPRLIALLLKGAQKVTIRVIDDRHKSKAVYTEFPADGAQSALGELLKIGCK